VETNVISPAKPINERERLAALESYDVLDSAPERAYDDIVSLASRICGTPIGLMGLVDADRVWHKARIGVPVSEAPRETSFCAHTILQEEPLVVTDLAADERFAENPNVVGGPRLRFYAGAPLVTAEGHAVGTICALDTVPRVLDAGQREALAALSRQLVAQLELRRMLAVSRREARTDPLTGLGNRRRLMADFTKLLPAATRTRPLHLLLFDLNGFKVYNDTFGHAAGDALLARLADKLAVVATEADGAYRFGGDEFCVLVRGDRVRLQAVRTAASLALSEHGDGFSITASHGVVSMPAEAATQGNALRLADERMYDEKGARSQVACRQTHDVLLSVLDERDPELRSHGSAVARLAALVGPRFGLDQDELRQLTNAAALHDIGKIAVPDAILNKPGPLSAAEWDFMKTHTLLGERILASAPALAHEATLVRSSHERWDGTGYPDKLAGEAIPLGSRIIFAVDACDAMTTARAYQSVRTQTEALAELHRCAGSQFDPAVIAILDDVLHLSSRIQPASSPTETLLDLAEEEVADHATVPSLVADPYHLAPT
jgi:diguanylate cyclase (GGDEF)-like protein